MTDAPVPHGADNERASSTPEFKKQHLIDPEICIRCNTCEATCPVGAVTHDASNYVVDADKCNSCMDCIAPCPTGSIDNWRVVRAPYSLDEQLCWTELPRQEDFGEAAASAQKPSRARSARCWSRPTPAAAASRWRRHRPPSLSSICSRAASPPSPPYRATTASRRQVRRARCAISCCRFGDTVFPVLEGQSIGIVAPGARHDGRPHDIRLYSIASSRDGEKRNANNVSLTVKRSRGGRRVQLPVRSQGRRQGAGDRARSAPRS